MHACLIVRATGVQVFFKQSCLTTNWDNSGRLYLDHRARVYVQYVFSIFMERIFPATVGTFRCCPV